MAGAPEAKAGVPVVVTEAVTVVAVSLALPPLRYGHRLVAAGARAVPDGTREARDGTRVKELPGGI